LVQIKWLGLITVSAEQEDEMAKLDHIMYAVSNLQDGINEVTKLTGVTAEFGGSHPGNGTCNALLSFGQEQYFEIIAPDPEQELVDNLGEELLNYHFSGIRTWAVSTADFEAVQKTLSEFDYQTNVVDMTRTTPDGIKLSWSIMRVTGHVFGKFMPFFINWFDSSHPSKTTPEGCNLTGFSVQLVENHATFKTLMNALDIDIEVVEGPDGMRALIDSPKGRVMLH
jgi:hypothetical protein